MKISDLIDQFVEVKAQREKLNEDAKACTLKLAVLEKDIMSLMSDVGITKAASDKASLTMREVKHPSIDNWTLFYDYVAQTGQFELLHKRLSSTAFREHWEAGDAIPGTSSSSVWELSVVRRK